MGTSVEWSEDCSKSAFRTMAGTVRSEDVGDSMMRIETQDAGRRTQDENGTANVISAKQIKVRYSHFETQNGKLLLPSDV